MHRLINRSRSNAKTSEKSSKKKPKGTKFHVFGALVPPLTVESPSRPDDLNSNDAQETDDVTTKVKTGEDRSDDVTPKATDDVTKKVKKVRGKSDDAAKIKIDKKERDDVTTKVKKEKKGTDDVTTKVKKEKKGTDDVITKVKKEKKGTDDVTTKVKDKKGSDNVTKKVKKNKTGDDVTGKKKKKKGKAEKNVEPEDDAKTPEVISQNDDESMTSRICDEVARKDEHEFADEKSDDDDLYEEPGRRNRPPMPRPIPTSSGGFHEITGRVPRHAPLPTPPQSRKSSTEGLYESSDLGATAAVNPRTRPRQRRPTSGESYGRGEQTENRNPNTTQSRPSSVEGLYETTDLVVPYKGSRHNSNTTSRPDSGDDISVNPRTRPRQRRPTSSESYGRGEQTENRNPNQTQSRPGSEEGLYETTDLIVPYKGSRHNSNTSRPDSGDDIFVNPRTRPRQRRPTSSETYGRGEQTENRNPNTTQSRPSSEEGLYETTDLVVPYQGSRHNSNTSRPDSGDDIYETADRVLQNRDSTISIGQRSKSSIDDDIYETADLNPSIRRPRSNATQLTSDEEGDIYNHLDTDQLTTTTVPRYDTLNRELETLTTEAVYDSLATDQVTRDDTLNRELETLPTEAVYDSLATDKVPRGRGDVIAVSYEDVSIVRETRNDVVPASDDVSDLGEQNLEPAAKNAEKRHETIDPYDDVVSTSNDVVSATDDVVTDNDDVSNQAKADLE